MLLFMMNVAYGYPESPYAAIRSQGDSFTTADVIFTVTMYVVIPAMVIVLSLIDNRRRT